MLNAVQIWLESTVNIKSRSAITCMLKVLHEQYMSPEHQNSLKKKEGLSFEHANEVHEV